MSGLEHSRAEVSDTPDGAGSAVDAAPAGDGPVTARQEMPVARQRATVLVASVIGFMIGLDATVVTTALPTIHTQLHASVATLGWTVSAYSLGVAALILTGTALGDMLGRRRVFLVGVALFALASAACAMAPTAALLIGARAVQGAAAGLAVPLSLVLVTEAVPPARRGAAVGVWGAITGLAVGCGPVIGGAIVQGLAWQWVFWLNVPIGLVLVTVGPRLLAESHGPARRLDPGGLVLATAAVFTVTDALLRGSQVGWRSAEVLSLAAAAVAFAAGFVIVESRIQQPVVPLRVFSNLPFTAAVASRFALFTTVLGCVFLMPQYLQLVHSFSPLRTGLGMLPFTGPVMSVAPVAGRLADRFGERVLIVTGFVLSTGGFGLLVHAMTATGSYATVAGPLLLAGIGVALAAPTTASATLRALPIPQVALASGIGATLQNLGGVFGIAVTAAVFASTGSYHTPTSIAHGLRSGLLTLVAFAVLGTVAATAAHPAPHRSLSR